MSEKKRPASINMVMRLSGLLSLAVTETRAEMTVVDRSHLKTILQSILEDLDLPDYED